MSRRWFVLAMTIGAASSAFAGPTALPLPEPGSLALLGAGAVAAVVVIVRIRRK
jgi:hypothetical protein